jgi:AcrR family transcriptional regulator
MKQATPDALIAAARRLFAKHGYEGTSVRAITNAARANLGAITYHFGSKRKLYDEVLKSTTGPLVLRAIEAARGSGTASERVAAVVHAYFAHLADNPEMARLMVQELVLERALPAPIVAAMRQIHGALTELVIAGQAAGEFRAGDPRIMAVGIISQPVHMNLVRKPLKEFAAIDFNDALTRADVIEQVTSFVCAGLAHEGSHS